MKKNLSTHPLQQFSCGLWAGGAYKYLAVKGEGGAGDTGNRWVHFQPSGKVKTTPGTPAGFQVLPHRSPWARGCRQALTMLGSICQPQHNVITDAQTKQHSYAQALRRGAKHAGDQTAMTCQSPAPSPQSFLQRNGACAASFNQMLPGRRQGRKQQRWG